MRILRNSPSLPIFALCAFSIAARVGFIASTFILLMSRFNVSPLISAFTSIALQGSITMMRQLSLRLFNRISLLNSQRLGAVLGAASCLLLISINNLVLFLIVVFIASFSKVAIESTFPRVTHAFLVDDEKFSSRLVGVQQGSVLMVCAIIAPIALSGSVLVPMFVASLLYLLTFVLALFCPRCGSDSYEEVIETGSSQQKFNRRFGDIVRNEDIRDRQSRIHKFRRIPSSLLSIDLFVNIIGSGCVVLMPICFKEISHLPQGMDPVFTLIFGTFAALTGLVFLPLLRRRVNLDENQEWTIVAICLPIGLVSTIFFSTIAGISIALFAAFVNGIAIATILSLIHQIAARNLTQSEYQKFGCQLMQRNAIARLVFPIFIGSIANTTSLHFAFVVLFVLALIFMAVNSARVILVVHGRKSDIRIIASIENPLHPARELRTDRREGEGITITNSRITFALLERRRIRSNSKQPTFNWVLFRVVSSRPSSTFSQKDSHVDAAWRPPG